MIISTQILQWVSAITLRSKLMISPMFLFHSVFESCSAHGLHFLMMPRSRKAKWGSVLRIKEGLNEQHCLRREAALSAYCMHMVGERIFLCFFSSLTHYRMACTFSRLKAFCWWNQNPFHRFKWGVLCCEWYWKSICRNRASQKHP